jgi:hypothetical protein
MTSKSISIKSAREPIKKLHPYWITGFIDAEGSFTIKLSKNESKTGYRVQPCFQIGLHEKDKALLDLIQTSLGGIGNTTKHGKDSIQYRVSSIKELQVIIDHFDKYPLITQKFADYLLFKRAFELVKSKEHLTTIGFHEIIAIKSSTNFGLSEKLKEHFADISPLSRPVVNAEIKDPNWLAGFSTGESCFFITIQTSKTKIGFSVCPRFSITQHSRDQDLIISVMKYFGCGKYYSNSKKDKGEFVVVKFSDLTDKIIPFFDKYPLQGAKLADYVDFKRVVEIMKNKEHLTESGLEQILRIKAGMNKCRIFEDKTD